MWGGGGGWLLCFNCDLTVCVSCVFFAVLWVRQQSAKMALPAHTHLTLNAPIATKVVCFARLLKYLRSLYGKQYGPRSDCSYRAVCSGSTLFASILNSSVMLGNYLQQTTTADDIFRCIFSWRSFKS